MELLTLIKNSLKTIKKKIYLAYSGGIDSTVLLHLMHSADINFSVVHINHNINNESEKWAKF